MKITTIEDARSLVGRTFRKGRKRLTIEGWDIEPPNGDVYFRTSVGLIWAWELAGATEVTQ
jgi:hypothetical protein